MDVYVEARGKPWYHSSETVLPVFRDRVSHSSGLIGTQTC